MAITTLAFIRSKRDQALHALCSTVIAAVLACTALTAHAQGLPNSQLTPGAINPDVTQDNISTTICLRGWTRTVRPPEAYTRELKRQQIAQYGYSDTDLRDYEEDHLVPLELGGAPTDPLNLWPQPHHAPDGWGSYAKDQLENRLRELVCSGALPLDQAQAAIATDWVAAYRQYVRPTPLAAGPASVIPYAPAVPYTPYSGSYPHHFHRAYWYHYR